MPVTGMNLDTSLREPNLLARGAYQGDGGIEIREGHWKFSA